MLFFIEEVEIRYPIANSQNREVRFHVTDYKESIEARDRQHRPSHVICESPFGSAVTFPDHLQHLHYSISGID